MLANCSFGSLLVMHIANKYLILGCLVTFVASTHIGSRNTQQMPYLQYVVRESDILK